MSPIDLLASLILLTLLVVSVLSYTVRLRISGAAHHPRVDAAGVSPLLGKGVLEMGYWCLQPLARLCVRAGLSPNQMTGLSLAFAAGSGLAVWRGHFGVAAALAMLSALGDALDGLIARTTCSVSPGGALFDATVDRYGEFFFLFGLALFGRDNPAMLGLALFTLLGSYMVSYGSAKAESIGVKAPRGAMRRVERATYLCAGALLTPISAALAVRFGWPAWSATFPMLAAVALVAVVANISAIRRLVAVGAAANAAAKKAEVAPVRSATVLSLAPPEPKPRTAASARAR